MSFNRRHRRSINLRAVLRVIGLLLLFESGFMLAPLALALHSGTDISPFVIAASSTLAAGLIMSSDRHHRTADMGKREGFMMTALVWIFFSLFGMIPFIIGSPQMCVTDAFFESMSGFTTTGISLITDPASASDPIMLWRCMMQWIGGLGIIIFTLAVLPMLNSSGGMQMFNAEATGITHDKIKPRVSQTAKRLWLIYIIMTIALCILLIIGGIDILDAICQAFTTVSTGGFSTHADFDGQLSSLYIKIVMCCFMLLGGINFALIYKGASGHLRQAWRNESFRYLIWTIIIFFLIFVAGILLQGGPISARSLTIDPLFQVISLISSTGYMVPGYTDWGFRLLLPMLLLMFFGACAGSTSGGAKLDRGIFMLRYLRNELYRVLHPNSVLSVSYNGHPVGHETIGKVMTFLTIYLLLIVFGGFLLTLCNTGVANALYTSLSCVSNAGASVDINAMLGISSATAASPAPPAKWIMSALMLTGRLEIFTVIVIFTPGFWRR